MKRLKQRERERGRVKEIKDSHTEKEGDRKSVVQGKSVDIGGRSIMKKKKKDILGGVDRK